MRDKIEDQAARYKETADDAVSNFRSLRQDEPRNAFDIFEFFVALRRNFVKKYQVDNINDHQHDAVVPLQRSFVIDKEEVENRRRQRHDLDCVFGLELYMSNRSALMFSIKISRRRI